MSRPRQAVERVSGEAHVSCYLVSHLVLLCRATALADLLGVDFALINRNRKRAQNKRIREARTQAALQAGGTLPSAMSSTDDLRSGFATPSAPPHDASHPEGSQSHQGGALRSVNDRLSNLRMEGGAPSPRSPLYSLIGNGVQANESGEFFITDEDGHRVFSGGAHNGHGHAHTQGHGPASAVAGQGQISSASFAAAEAAESALQEGEAKMEILVGDVEGKVAILVDDMVDTGRTLALAAKTLRDAGAKEVYAHISHGILSGKAVELLRKLEMKRLVVSIRASQIASRVPERCAETCSSSFRPGDQHNSERGESARCEWQAGNYGCIRCDGREHQASSSRREHRCSLRRARRSHGVRFWEKSVTYRQGGWRS